LVPVGTPPKRRGKASQGGWIPEDTEEESMPTHRKKTALITKRIMFAVKRFNRSEARQGGGRSERIMVDGTWAKPQRKTLRWMGGTLFGRKNNKRPQAKKGKKYAMQEEKTYIKRGKRTSRDNREKNLWWGEKGNSHVSAYRRDQNSN